MIASPRVMIADIIVAECIAGIEKENLVLTLALANLTHFPRQILESANHTCLVELRGTAPGIACLRGSVPRGGLERSMATVDVVRVQNGNRRRR